MSQEIISKFKTFFDAVRKTTADAGLSPRMLTESNIYNDAEVDNGSEDKIIFDYEKFTLQKLKEFVGVDKEVDLIGVDTSTVHLGNTETGIASAIRACIVSKINGVYSFDIIGPQILLINKDNRRAIFESTMKAMGFSEKQIKEKTTPDFTVLMDRVRNWMEKETQRIAIGKLSGGIVLFDGTLIGETHDVKEEYVKETLRLAEERKNHVVAISKKTRLYTKDGRPVVDLLSDKINPCYLRIKNILDTGREVSLGDIFAAKFSMDGYTFRVDTYPYLLSHDDILNILFSNSIFRLGYPDVLRYAHILCYFTAKDVLELQALACVKYNLKMRSSYNIRPALFGPFTSKGG